MQCEWYFYGRARQQSTQADIESSLNGLSGVQFDIIFIDAHKGEYIEYFEIILQKGLLQPNGIILVDDSK